MTLHQVILINQSEPDLAASCYHVGAVIDVSVVIAKVAWMPVASWTGVRHERLRTFVEFGDLASSGECSLAGSLMSGVDVVRCRHNCRRRLVGAGPRIVVFYIISRVTEFKKPC